MTRKALFWTGSSLDDLRRFPSAVREEIGFALHLAQSGSKHISAKPLKGFDGSSIWEVISDHAGNTYRAVYTIRFKGAVYVLHAFQKKSRKGIRTPKKEIALVGWRLKAAENHYRSWSDKSGQEESP